LREIAAEEITGAVKALCMEAACRLEPDVVAAVKGARDREASELGRDVLSQIITNFEIAEREGVPMCQDTGVAVFFIEVGREVALGGALEDAVNAGVREGYSEGYLRKSVCDPIKRTNTGDNTPAVIHTSIVEGDRVRIRFAAKGAGSENMSRLKMLKPADGIAGVKDFVVESIAGSGGNPCPPIVVGVGIGGDFEMCAILAKEALLRRLGSTNPDPELRVVEDELMERINATGIGPMGFGGTVTALAVHVLARPCHIASLPVAMNVQCHADRHKEITL